MNKIRFFIYIIKDIIFQIGNKWDQLSPSIQDVIEYAHNNINPEPTPNIDRNHKSLEWALGHYGQLYNDHIRRGLNIDETEKDISQKVYSNTCTCNLIVYRGVHDHIFDAMIAAASSLEKIDLYEPAYMQCSLIKGCESNTKTKLRIFVPAKSHVIYLGNVNEEQNFYEVVIMHGASLKIVSIDNIYINCKLISTDEPFK